MDRLQFERLNLEPGVCLLDQLPTELLLVIFKQLDTSSLCALSLVSKRCQHTAQDVLYHDVDLRPVNDEEGVTESNISMFLWTICHQPHLGDKVQKLSWMPSYQLVKPRIESPRVVDDSCLSIDLPDSYVCEQYLAGKILNRLPNLGYIIFRRYSTQARTNRHSATFPEEMSLQLDALSSVPGLAKLARIYVYGCCLNWIALSLGTLWTLYLGFRASVDLPHDNSVAGNITKFRFITHHPLAKPNKAHFTLTNVTDLLARFPNLQDVLVYSKKKQWSYALPLTAFGYCCPNSIYAMLDSAPSIKSFAIRNFGQSPDSQAHSEAQIDLRKYFNLTEIRMTEEAFIGDMGIEGVPYVSPAAGLPRSIERVTISFTNARISESRPVVPRTRALGWLELFSKAEFLCLEWVAVACSDGFGNVQEITNAVQNSAGIQSLRDSRVGVWIWYDPDV
ncbi:hypothetical protein T440DRAFT_469640 [Plenodomus tracheiphilus IPT5]|uniref:F-box domain-containing protein n=1 Tax=Plenodomus tracheiphilus IPT5 TaxID=1408161 RepID=A0A6A7B3J1_9PLEO|nr:hypothetical protein T440DRAFT_469640 [Plenodomus tracheiphilus IPT5]